MHTNKWSHEVTRSEVVDVVVLALFLLPESQVLLEELNDGLGISEVVLLELVDLVKSILESLVSELAGGLVVLHDFVVEDGEVEGKTELDWVAWWEGDLVSLVVGLEGVLLDLLHELALGVLGNVAVVVTDHLDEESLGLTLAGLGENLLLDHVDDELAVLGELGLNGSLVVGEGIGVLGVLWVLLDGGDGAAGSSLGGDEVLEGDGEEVALVGGDLSTFGVEDLGEELNHILESLGLLSNAGKENVLFNRCHSKN